MKARAQAGAWRGLLVALVVVCGLASIANAQETGGHMGGGDWGGGGSTGGGSTGGGSTGGGFSGGSSPSWSSDSGWSHSSIPTYKPPDIPAYKPPTYRPPTDHGGSGIQLSPEEIDRINRDMQEFHRDMDRDRSVFNFFFWGVALFIAGVFVKILWENFRGESSSPFPTFAGTTRSVSSRTPDGEIDVTVLRVAIDGRARKFIQTTLREIAKNCDTSTKNGRASMLKQVTQLLRKVRDAWVYGGAHNEAMGPLSNMKATYDRHVDDARTRFQVETISNVQGRTTQQDAGALAWRSDEGEGIILVTIVIAARTELFTVSQIADGEDLRNALEGAGHLGSDQLVAVDVIWMPAEENDRMSSIELTAKYPNPELIPIRGALVGKTFCTYCAGPFPAELVSCPHCGAPAHDRAA